MLLTITSTHHPATDLAYLLHKDPARVHSADLAFGQAHMFFPEATPERCTAALLLDVDPLALVRGRPGASGESAAQDPYVSDRPYVASSYLSLAIARLLGTALSGRSKERQALANTPLNWDVTLTAVPCREGGFRLSRLFEPLGYAVAAAPHPLDPAVPEWGPSPYHTLRLQGTCRLQELLSHLYVLIPVVDDEKHYWLVDGEVDRLLRHGAGWLARHPENERIVHQPGGSRRLPARPDGGVRPCN